MSEPYTTGAWTVEPGKETAFVEAWTAFATWAATMPGAGTLRLTRDLGQPGRYVSFGSWATLEDAHAWKQTPQFREKIAHVVQHCESFANTELEVVASAGAAVPAAPVR